MAVPKQKLKVFLSYQQSFDIEGETKQGKYIGIVFPNIFLGSRSLNVFSFSMKLIYVYMRTF
jgi:hypothetical protein